MAGMRRMAVPQRDRSVDGQKILEQARADGGGALGVELRAVEIAPLHAGAEGRAVARARNRGGAQVRARSCARNRRSRRPPVPRAARRRRRISRVFQPMCGTGRSGSRGEARGAAGNDAKTAGFAFLEDSYSNCIPRQMPSTGCAQGGNQRIQADFAAAAPWRPLRRRRREE